jgi:hypothetical protein
MCFFRGGIALFTFLCAPCASARKQRILTKASADYPLIRKPATTVRSSRNQYISYNRRDISPLCCLRLCEKKILQTTKPGHCALALSVAYCSSSSAFVLSSSRRSCFACFRSSIRRCHSSSACRFSFSIRFRSSSSFCS